MTPEPGHAIVRVAWAPARAEPGHRAELTSQWPCGESLEVLEERSGWLRCRGEDDYEAWTPVGGVLRVGFAEASAWRSAADGLSLGTVLIPTGGEMGTTGGPRGGDEAGTTGQAHEVGTDRRLPIPARLPLGSRVRRHEDGSVELPTGARARGLDPHGIVPIEDLPARFRASGAAVATTTRRWLGAPYVWGGRTEWGFDCSGLVQVVFRLHGVRLPRDSVPQAAAGPEVPGLPDAVPLPFPGLLDPLLPGDLLFFAPEGRGITHVAIHAGEGRILHAAASNGCVAADDLRGDEELAARLRGSVVAVTRPLPSG